METRRSLVCAWVTGDVEDLNRPLLKEEFSKFGNVTKIFIESDGNYAKVYLDDPESTKRACGRLNGHKSWAVKVFKDDYKKHKADNINNSFSPRSYVPVGNKSFDSDIFSKNSGSNFEQEMDEDCVYAGEYVDVHGRTVEVLQAEDGQLFVNLNDVRASGYNIYRKDSYEKASISKEVDLRHFENYLLNEGKKYILSFKQTFNENEMLSVFERVRAKLQSADPAGCQFGEGRVINSTQSKNLTITAKNNVPSPESSFGSNVRNVNRSPKLLPENFQPSFSFSHQKRSSQDSNQNRQNGKPFNDSMRPQNNTKNRRSGDFRDKKTENNSSFVENYSQMRKPKFNYSGGNTMTPKPVDNEPEETWEDQKEPVVAVPKPRSQNDASSVSNERKMLNVDRVQLACDSTYKVKVSYFKPDKKGIFYGQSIENLNLIDEILLHVNTEDNNLPEINKPVRDMLCVASFEECWYRAIVIFERPTPGHAFVELIDYGNKEEIKTPIREMSEAMKKIPGQAIRFAINTKGQGSDTSLQIGQDLEVVVKKNYDDGTHVVQIKSFLETTNVDDEPETSPTEGSSNADLGDSAKPANVSEEDCFTEVPRNAAKIISGESVIIVNYTENKLLLRNKETATICRDVYTHLHNMKKNPISNPKAGQLVLCSKDTDEGLHRAIIKKINGNAAELEFVDYYGGEVLSLKSLRNIDKVLASYPRAVIEQDYSPLEQLAEKSYDMLSELIYEKKKLKTTTVDGKLDFLLTEDDKTVLLSEKIKELAEAPPAKQEQMVEPAVEQKNNGKSSPSLAKEETAAKEESVAKKETAAKENTATPPALATVGNNEEYVDIIYDDMPFITAQLGPGLYCAYCCKGDSITIVSLSEENASHLEELTISEPSDKAAHAPKLFEMCLAKFEDTWYRALVTEEIDGDMFEVLFVDYGNAENINKTELRRFPKKFATIPILAINAYFIGIPDTPKVHNKLKDLIPDETVLTVNVKEDINENLKYGIEIPSVYKTLKDEGFL